MLSTAKVPVRVVCEMLSQKYCGAPESTAARVTMPRVWPAPVAPLAYSGSRSYHLAKSDGRWQPLGRPNLVTQALGLPCCGVL
jgi:hypothetical protein